MNKSYEALKKVRPGAVRARCEQAGDKFSKYVEAKFLEVCKEICLIVVVNKCESIKKFSSYRVLLTSLPTSLSLYRDVLSGSGIRPWQAIINQCKQDDIGATDGIVNKGDVVLLVTPV